MNCLESILNLIQIFTAHEVLSKQCPVPANYGVYSWCFVKIPPVVPTAGCSRHENFILFNFRISPRRSRTAGIRPCKQTFRSWIRYHFQGNVEESTLHPTPGYLLQAEIGIQLRRICSTGFCYRLLVRNLVGYPDLVFSRLHKVIYMHGCFWNRKRCANEQVIPETRTDIWNVKLKCNVAKDAVTRRQLRREDWKVLVVREYETRIRDLQHLQTRLVRFLES